MISYGLDINHHIYSYQKAALLYRAAFWFYLSLLFPLSAMAAYQPQDTVHNILPDLEVRQIGRSPIRKSDDGDVTVKAKDILRLSRSFGEADLIDKISIRPLAESTGDYSSGLSVNGTEPGQAQYIIDGAPVIFPYRFGGIFSTFNASHFSSMNFSRHSGADLPPRLGAVFRLSPALRFCSGAEGSATAGMTASSVSLRAGVSGRFAISLSGRISYINRLYGRWLVSSETGLKYDFHDINADAAFRISDKDIISFTLMQSTDNLTYDDRKYTLATSIRWHNTLYNIRYRHTGDLDIRCNIYHSSFADRLGLEMPQMLITAPAALSTTGADLRIGKGNTPYHLMEWNCGIKLIHDHTTPQWAILKIPDAYGTVVRASQSNPQKMLTAIAYGSTRWWIIPERLKLSFETGIGWFRSKTKGYSNYSKLIFTPSVTLSGDIRETRLSLTFACLNQPMHRVGFSELGLATDFWIGADKEAPIQRAFTISGNVNKRLPWCDLDLEAGAFLNSVSNQVEYQGQVIETIDTQYSPFTHLIVSDGYNYGGYASLSRTFGQLTGELNISYSSGRRHDPADRSHTWTPLYSQGLVLKSSAIWTDGSHWTISAAFRLASGRRYTPVEALYVIGENIAMEYGKRNSDRLPLYHRLDVGTTYSFSTGRRLKLHHIFNLSLINAYGHKNVEMQYFILNSQNGDYSLKRLYSLYRFLPSISYTIEF